MSCLFDVFTCLTLNGFYINFIEFLYKQLTIFGINNRLYRSSENTNMVLF